MAKDKDKDAKPKKQEAQPQQQPKAPKKEQQSKKAVAPPLESGPRQPAPPARLALQYRDKIDAIRGMDIAINTTARNDDEARALLTAFRFPFRVDQVKPEPKKQETQTQEPQMQAQKG